VYALIVCSREAMAMDKIILTFFWSWTSIVTFGANPLHEVRGFQVPVSNRVKIQTAPLIGGPSWLKVHCKVVLDDSHVFDFVPLNAASTETIQKLMTLQPVPATIRRTKTNNNKKRDGISKKRSEDDNDNQQLEELYVQRAVHFCEDYDQDLHLIRNNCWSFAFDLIRDISNL